MTTPSPPVASPTLSAGFRWYTRRYLRKHFHAVRASGLSHLETINTDDSVLCFLNHPSWWDPLLAVLVTESLLPRRQFYAPIDADALNKYRVFKRLGFYGLGGDSQSGAKSFLSITRQLLSQNDSAIWLTPGGRFQDVREPTTFEPGLGHLAAGLAQSNANVTLLPVAFEYPFWQERTPEALVHFGAPTRLADASDRSKSEWQTELESQMAAVQTALATKSISQEVAEFETILDGTVGIGGVYDLFRRIASAVRGQPFDAGHTGTIAEPPR